MPLTLPRYLSAQAHNNAWCNHRLLLAAQALSTEEAAAPRTSFFPSILATLNHNVTVDWYYVDALERGLHDQPVNSGARAYFDLEQPFDALPPLSQAQRAVDARLVALCEALTSADLEREIGVQRRVGVLYEPLPRLLAHLFQHQIHHRGQVHGMLAGTRVAPPQLDEFFCANEVHLRAAELAELGTSEQQIWGA